MAITKIHNSYVPENAVTSDPKEFSGAPPSGYGRAKSLPQEAKNIARNLLSGEYGTMTPFEVGNNKFMARVEPHYHDPNSNNSPKGWHKGVTIYESLDSGDKFLSEPPSEISAPKDGLLAKLDTFLSNI